MKCLQPRVPTRTSAIAPVSKKIAAPIYHSMRWRSLMRYLFRIRGRRCQHCGRSDGRIFGDHIIELRDGGAAFDANNVQLLCGSCHTKKTAMMKAARAVAHPPSPTRGGSRKLDAV